MSQSFQIKEAIIDGGKEEQKLILWIRKSQSFQIKEAIIDRKILNISLQKQKSLSPFKSRKPL
jgi:hypothetical protein